MEKSQPGGRVLILSQEADMVRLLSELMFGAGLTPIVASNGDVGLECVRREHPDLLLLDFQMPGKDGLELLQQAKAIDPDLLAVPITEFADVRGAVEAMRAGAHDYLAKPLEQHQVIHVVRRALNERRLRSQVRLPSMQLCQERSLREILGPSDAVSKLISDVQRVAKSNFSVVIVGETGSGKEVIARAIHQASLRCQHPFVPVDCGAIPEPLLESELFGHERGAFTGASQQKQGRFESARGGTLFLDEVCNLPLSSQAKLLRVLQDKILYHVGGTQQVRVDARLLAASNHDLQELVDKASFRRDLYFRLNEFMIQVPPLRHRREDVPYLAQQFLDITNVELSKQVKGFTPCALEAMQDYHWPGNVRQLRSVIRRAVLMAEDSITADHLALDHPSGTRQLLTHEPVDDSWNSLPLREIVKRHTMSLERDVITQTLRRMGGNKAKAARLLQIDYKTIHSKVKEYRIESNGELDHGQEE